MTAEPDFEQSWWQRTRYQLGRIYKSWAFGITLTVALLITSSLALIITQGPTTPTEKLVAVPIVVGAATLATAFLGVLIVQSIATLVIQRNEARHRVRTLEQETQALEADPLAAEAEQRERDRMDDIRVAIAELSEELEHGDGMLSSPTETFSSYKLADEKWREHRRKLAAFGLSDAHREVRIAYRLIDEFNRRIKRRANEFGEYMDTQIDVNKANEARPQIATALAALENAAEELGSPET